MTFFEKNEENLEALAFSLSHREKTTFVIGIYDCDDTYNKAIAYIKEEFKTKQSITFDFFGQKTDSLLAFFRAKLSLYNRKDFPIVHITRIDPLLFITKNHKIISAPLVAQINMERELLFHEVEALVVLWLTREGYNRLRIDAPDFMDWVVASFVFENDGVANTQTLSFELPKETVADKNKAEIQELQEKALKLQQRTVKFEQGTRLTIKDKKEYFNLLLALIEAYKNLHYLEKSQKTLEKAYKLAKENNLVNGFEFGKLLGDWGDIEISLGNLSNALTLFEEALQHFEVLKDVHNIAICLERLGDTHSSLGNLEKALGFFEEYNRLEKDLYATYPTNVHFKNGLAISYSKLGSTHSSLGNLDKALGFFEEYNRLEKDLYTTYPTNVEYKNGLAISYERLGETHSSLGNLEKALEFFEKYNQLKKELYIAYPTNVHFKNGLAISYSKLGSTHSSLGNLENALIFNEKANQTIKELYIAYPTNVHFKNGLAISYSKLGSTHSSLGNLEKALFFFQEYNRLEKDLYAAYPTNVSFKNGLAISYERLGSMHGSLGNLEKALFFFQEYNRLEEDFHAIYPTNTNFKNGLAISYERLGSIHNSLGNLEKALFLFQEYNQLGKELYKISPNNVDFKNNYAESLAVLFAIQKCLMLPHNTQDIDTAIALFEEIYAITKTEYYQKKIMICQKMKSENANMQQLISEMSRF